MQVYALKTNFKIWNDGINLYGYIYCVFPYFSSQRNYTLEIASESPLAVTFFSERVSLRMLDIVLCLNSVVCYLLLIVILIFVMRHLCYLVDCCI